MSARRTRKGSTKADPRVPQTPENVEPVEPDVEPSVTPHERAVIGKWARVAEAVEHDRELVDALLGDGKFKYLDAIRWGVNGPTLAEIAHALGD